MATAIIRWRDINAPSINNQFRIYRSTSPIDTSAPGAPYVDALPKGTAEYEDTGLVHGTTYYYVVSSYTDTLEEFGPEQKVVAGPCVYAGTGSDDVSKVSVDGTLSAFTTDDFSEMSTILRIEVDHLGNIHMGDSYGNIAKYDARGNLLWKVTSDYSRVYALGIDGDGHVYAGGQGVVGFSKHDGETGAKVYSDVLSGAVNGTYRYVRDIAIDAQGNIAWVAGGGNNPPTAAQVGKSDPSGNLIWNHVITTSNAFHTHTVVVDPSLNTYIAYSNGTYPTSKQSNIIRAYDPAGNELWTYLTGYYATLKDVANVMAYSPVNDNIYLAEKGVNENHLRCLNAADGADLGIVASDVAQSLAVDHLGNIYCVLQDKVTVFDSAHTQIAQWTVEDGRMDSDYTVVCDPGRYAVNNNTIVV